MTIADKARDAAIHCEMKKVAYRQTKDGIVVSFVLHPHEVPIALSTSHIGARYIAALVEIGDNEQPITPAEKEANPTATSFPATPSLAEPSEKAKRGEWHDMLPSAQAAIRCTDVLFCTFLWENYGFDVKDKDQAAIVVRQLCKVESRKEFNTDLAAKVRWQGLEDQFLAWRFADA